MGSVSSMKSIERFLDAHGSAIEASILAGLPPSLRSMGASISLDNEVSKIGVSASWSTAAGGSESIALESIDIYEAADIDDREFGGDCDMGW